nr:aldehyde dehydrogenase family protein [Nocardia sp. BMG111209]
MLIDGRLVEGRAGAFDNVDPATEEVLGAVADASAEDVHAAIDAARRAFDDTSWSTDHLFRRTCLLQLQDALESEREEMREELIREAGCPRALTFGPQLDTPLDDALTCPAERIDSYPWRSSLGRAGGTNPIRQVWREPVGVVGAIVPWHFPFAAAVHTLGRALATGNTVVLKPAPDTPFNATRLGRMIAEHTDIPPGVVNVVTASSHRAGETLTRSPKVDMISFTGSTAAGRRIMADGAATMKRLLLELSGRSATIVLADADPDLGRAVGLHAAQGWAHPTRLLLPRSRYDEGVALLESMYRDITAGDPQDPAVRCGPVVSAAQRDRVRGHIRTGIAEGARLLVGGPGQPDGLDTGFFVRPTLFADVDSAMTIAREEILGPVSAVIPYDGEDDAVRIANHGPHGLAVGAVMSGSVEHALAVAARLRAESVGVNGTGYSADTPFGGYRAGGVGHRYDTAGFEQYTAIKSVTYPAR